MKTKREILKEKLPKEIFNKVVKYADETIDEPCKGFQYAINVFWWHLTPEGFKHWASIYEQYK